LGWGGEKKDQSKERKKERSERIEIVVVTEGGCQRKLGRCGQIREVTPNIGTHVPVCVLYRLCLAESGSKAPKKKQKGRSRAVRKKRSKKKEGERIRNNKIKNMDKEFDKDFVWI
jgi:hypothetical protein